MLNFLIFIAILSVLIIAHEFGHFLAARRNGVRVERFALGFGPALFKIKGKETDFLICLCPLGGYVKLAGESRNDSHGFDYEFFTKPIKAKIEIVLAGPLFNYFFAFILFWLIALLGFPYLDSVIGKVKEGYPAMQAGLKDGDRILAVNGKAVDNWTDMTSLIRANKEKASLRIQRGNDVFAVDVPLTKSEIGDEFGRRRNMSVIGIEASPKIKIIKYGFWQGFLKAGESLFNLTFLTIKGFLLLILGIVPAKEAITGPLGIYYITAETIKLGIVAVFHLMAILNVSLTVVNLIPLPLFDGGHILIFLIEKIRNKQLSEKVDAVLTRVGFAIIGLIVLFVFYNDILKFGSRIWGK
ncbi:MAG: RIP metalloprotease RseP [Candidatus Omnitrophota bacterium]